jgi:hypothetical protein
MLAGVLDAAGGLWVQAAFLGQWQFGGGCSLQLWSQVTVLSTADGWYH